MTNYTLLKTEKNARRGRFMTVHGDFETPCFMNVATAAAIKGGLSSGDLAAIGCQVMLSNTYHLHIRPGDELIGSLGGIRTFTGWRGPVLTDSGGFQIFSLASIRKIREEGVHFASHLDGKRIFIGPEESMRIQSNLGSTIAMAFDECIGIPAEYTYARQSAARTVRWLSRCKAEMGRMNGRETAVNPNQLLFGINQGCCFDDIRTENMKAIADMELDGYAIGGLAVGETEQEMYRVVSLVEEWMPKDKIRYLMGVGTPVNILESVARGVDLFDCVMPTRNGRHGHFFTWNGVININNAKYAADSRPLDEHCGCPVCRTHSRAYLRHLLKAREVLALRFGALHNLWFYNELMQKIRDSLDDGAFYPFYCKYREILGKRI